MYQYFKRPTKSEIFRGMAKKETAGITKKLTKSLMKTGKHTTEN